MNASSQNHAFAVRNSEHEGYSILDNNGVERYELPRYAEPIFDGIIRSGSYPDLIKIPLYNQIYPIRYLGNFYLIDMSGKIISKLHENTEWVHPFKNGISRVTLINYGAEKIFCDMYIDKNGNNVFGKIFRDGNNFINGKAAIKYMNEEKWVIIDDKENELLNVSALTDNPISVIVNIQEDIWKINFKNFEESLYFSISGQTSTNPNDLDKYKSNETHLKPQLINRLKKEQSHLLYKHLPRKTDHFILYDTIPNSFKKKPTIYSNQMEEKILTAEGTKDTIVPQRIVDDFIIAKSKDGFYVYNRSNLKFIGSTIDSPVQMSDKVILTTRRNGDYEKKNLIHLISEDKELTTNLGYKIISNQSKISNKEEIKELILINPSEKDFSSIHQYRNLEVVSIYKYEGESIDMNVFSSLEFFESLNFYECRKLLPNSLNLNENNIEFLTIKRCNKLKNFSPDESKWKNLKMYTLRNIRKTTGKEKKITVGNKS